MSLSAEELQANLRGHEALDREIHSTLDSRLMRIENFIIALLFTTIGTLLSVVIGAGTLLAQGFIKVGG